MSGRMRHTKSQKGQRRSHHAVSVPRLTRDTKTDSWHLRHHVDMSTGMYRGRKVIDVDAIVEKKMERETEKRRARGEEA